MREPARERVRLTLTVRVEVNAGRPAGKAAFFHVIVRCVSDEK